MLFRSTYFVVRHETRILSNQMVNWKLAADQPKIEFLPCHGPLAGAANQPQDMIVWPGLELICYARKGFRNHPVSGVVYVFEGWKGGYLHIRQHDDYDGQPLIRTEDVEPAEAVESDEEAEVTSTKAQSRTRTWSRTCRRIDGQTQPASRR